MDHIRMIRYVWTTNFSYILYAGGDLMMDGDL